MQDGDDSESNRGPLGSSLLKFKVFYREVLLDVQIIFSLVSNRIMRTASFVSTINIGLIPG